MKCKHEYRFQDLDFMVYSELICLMMGASKELLWAK
jgi:hypothetical protein